MRPETIENRWDILYRDYSDVYERFASSPYTPSVFRILPQPFAFAGKTVADVGGGTGKSSLAFAQVAEQVIHVEPEPAMHKIAIGRAIAQNIHNVEFVTGDCFHTTLPDASVDIVTAITAPFDVTEAMRILRPGGVAIYVEIPPGWYGGELCDVIAHHTAAHEKDVALKMAGFSAFDFDTLQDYGTLDNILETYGFIFGMNAIQHLRKTKQTTIKWRCRVYSQVKDMLFPEPSRMFITTYSDRNFFDASTPERLRVNVPAGRYEVERMPNPTGVTGYWLVLKGTKIGIGEQAMRQCTPDEYAPEDVITIEE